MSTILLSRKFLVALVGLIMAGLVSYVKLPESITQTLYLLLLALISAVTIEDLGKHLAGDGPENPRPTVKAVFLLVVRSRQFQVALVGFVAALLTHYSGMPEEIVVLFTRLFAAVIVGGAVESAGKSMRPE